MHNGHLLSLIATGAIAAWPIHAVTAIAGISCEPAESPRVCWSPKPTTSTTLQVSRSAERWLEGSPLPISYLGDRGTVDVQSTRPQSHPHSTLRLRITVSQPTEVIVGPRRDPSAIFYLDVARLPPWPHARLDLRLPRHNLVPSIPGKPSPTRWWKLLQSANAAEGREPMRLPANFFTLPAADQLFILANLERIVHGLWPLYGVTRGLNHAAQHGVETETDPAIRGSAKAWGSNWYSGAGAIAATFNWMYNDGYGSGNVACSAPGLPGCWGHRKNLLGAWGPYGLFGGAVIGNSTSVSRGTAEIFEANLIPPGPGQTVYTWHQAVQAGARPKGL